MSYFNRFPFAPFLLGCLSAALIFAGALQAVGGPALVEAKLGWFLFSLGISGLLTAAIWRSGEGAFALATLSALAGGTATLWLKEPLVFPALLSDFTAPHNLAVFGIILLQALVVLFLGIPRIRGFLTIVRDFGLVLLILLGLTGMGLSVSIQKYLPHDAFTAYGLQLALGGAIWAVQLVNAALLLALPAPTFLTHLPRPGLLVLVAFMAAMLMGWLGFSHIPHVEDEVAYLSQARLFANGLLWAPAPPEAIAAGLDYYLFQNDGTRIYPVTTPGWPAVLAVGVWLGQPWLINPLLMGACVWLGWRLLRNVTDNWTAGVGALLAATCPWLIGAAGALMPHLAATAATLGAWVLLSRRPPTLWAFCAAGALMGYVFTNRQLDGVVLGTVTGLILLFQLNKPGGVARLVAYGLGCIAIGGLYLAHNAALTGHALHSPLQDYINIQWHAGANAFGFGPNIGPHPNWGSLDWAPGHGPFEGLINTAHTLSVAQLDILGWTIGSLTLPIIHLLWGYQSRLDVWAWIVVGLVILLHSAYWFSGSFYIGPRYWFALFAPALFLTVRGLETLGTRMGLRPHMMLPALWISCLFALLIFTPWRGVEKYNRYGDFTAETAKAVKAHAFNNEIVLWNEGSEPGAALIYNDLTFPSDRPIFLRTETTLDPEQIRAAFPDRDIIYWPNPE